MIEICESNHKMKCTYSIQISIMDFLSKLKDGLQQIERTHGIEIRELKVTEGVNLSIWDMVGQKEFHAFHVAQSRWHKLSVSIPFGL